VKSAPPCRALSCRYSLIAFAFRACRKRTQGAVVVTGSPLRWDARAGAAEHAASPLALSRRNLDSWIRDVARLSRPFRLHLVRWCWRSGVSQSVGGLLRGAPVGVLGRPHSGQPGACHIPISGLDRLTGIEVRRGRPCVFPCHGRTVSCKYPIHARDHARGELVRPCIRSKTSSSSFLRA
jgi:hypothetical protein